MLDIRWKQLECEVRLLIPYGILYEGNAETGTTIIVFHNTRAVLSLGSAVLRYNYFHAFLELPGTLADVLVTSIRGIPFSTAEFLQDWLGYMFVSLTILALMVLTVPAVIVWK